MEPISIILSALMIMLLRITDVSLGTMRVLFTVQGKKWIAGTVGFIEVTIWIFAIRHIMLNLGNIWNVFGYSGGFAIGTILGITVEQKIGSGFVQLYVISMYFTDKIADKLRENHIGITILPGEGTRGGVAVLYIMVTRKRQKEVIKLVEEIDPNAVISIQSAVMYRGYIHTRK